MIDDENKEKIAGIYIRVSTEVEGKRYASKYQMINNEYKLEDINDNKDWDLVDLYLDKYDKGELL